MRITVNFSQEAVHYLYGINKKMAASAITINDFMNLLKPGQIGELGFILQTALSNLTTTAMLSVLPADVKALGPLITAVRTAGMSTALAPSAASTGPKFIANIKKVSDEYATIPPFINTYVTQNAQLPSSGAKSIFLASINPIYNTLLKYLNKSIDDLGSIMVVNIIQQNESKTDAATITALTALITSYINYLNAIVKAFKFNTTELDPNYDLIITNIEKTLNKIGVTVSTPSSILLSDLNSLTIPLPAVIGQKFTPPAAPPAIPPNTLLPDGSILINSDNGYNMAGKYQTQFPDPTQVICLNQNPITYTIPLPVLPEPGWSITGKYVQAGTTLVSIRNWQAPSNPYVRGLLVTMSKPMVGQRGEGDKGSVYTYKFTPPDGSPIRTAAAAAYAPAQAAYESAVRVASGSYATVMRQYNLLQSGALAALPRPTPDGPIVELAKSINISLNQMIATKAFGPLKNLKTITAIKEIPNTFGALVNYILSNRTFLVTIGNQLSYVTDYMAPLFPIPAATQQLYNTLNIGNFETNLTQANTGILTVIVSKYTNDFSLNLIQKIVNRANSTLGTDAQKISGASIISKIFAFYIQFLNSIINTFKINLGADISINPHITLINKVLSKMKIMVITTPVASGGRRKKSLHRKKLRRKHKTKRRPRN